jgi:ATP-dependent helicase/nuclease subunit A
VHGAKGLEAHTVILADTTTRPQGYQPPRLLDVSLAGGSGLVWAKSQDTDPRIVESAREAAKEASIAEYKRLLYVAMTRAEQRMVICGAASKVNKDDEAVIPDQCWYRLIEGALIQTETALTIEMSSEDGDGQIWRLRKDVFDFPAHAEDVRARTETPLPGWIDKPVPAEPLRAVAITPSDADEIEWKRGTGEGEREQALERGRLLHRLIQSLPDLPPENRAAAADDYLRRNREKVSPEQCVSLAAQALAILDDARFAPLFAPGSRAEVPLIGILPRDGLAPYSVTGQIDRLAVTETDVLIADYKTNRPAPTTLDDIPRAYRRQLALYRALLQRIYPRRTVRAALVWTENATLMELPQAALDAELATLTRS